MNKRVKSDEKVQGGWIASRTKYLVKYATIMHTITGEICVNTKYGELWPYSADKTSVMVTSPTIARKLGKYFGADLTITQGEELVYTFDNKHIDKVMTIMLYKNNRVAMLKRANSSCRM